VLGGCCGDAQALTGCGGSLHECGRAGNICWAHAGNDMLIMLGVGLLRAMVAAGGLAFPEQVMDAAAQITTAGLWHHVLCGPVAVVSMMPCCGLNDQRPTVPTHLRTQ
jgi:hypothetical protein